MKTNNYSGRGAMISLGIAAFAFFYPLVPVYDNIPGINASVFEALVRAFEEVAQHRTGVVQKKLFAVVVGLVVAGFGVIGFVGWLIGSMFKRPHA